MLMAGEKQIDSPAAATAACRVSPLPVSPRAKKRKTCPSEAGEGITIGSASGRQPAGSAEPRAKTMDPIPSRKTTISKQRLIFCDFVDLTIIPFLTTVLAPTLYIDM